MDEIACSLSESERHSRAAEMAELGARALVGIEVDSGRATLRFAGEHEGLEVLVVAESRCCAFFEFDLARDGDLTELEVRAPDGADWAVRGLVAGIVAGWANPAPPEPR